MAGLDNDTVYGTGLDLSGNSTVSNKLDTDGFIYFGNSAGNPVAALPTSTNDTIGYVGTNGGGRFENRRWLSAFVVDPSSSEGSRGTYSTIQSAITAASSGDLVLIRPGTYTENIALKDGVDLIALTDRFSMNKPEIVGKCSLSSGSCSIKGLQLSTNSDYVVSATGTANINLDSCLLSGDDNTLIEHTSSLLIRIERCSINLNTTGVAVFSSTGSGDVYIRRCTGGNGGGSTTQSSKSAGQVRVEYTSTPLAISCSSSGSALILNSNLENLPNVTSLTTSGTGVSVIENSMINSGTASAIDIGSGTTVKITNSSVKSSNTNAITGAGTLNYGDITFTGTSSNVNTTTQTPFNQIVGQLSFDGGSNFLANYEEGSWTPGFDGSTGSPTITYTTQVGKYTRIGNICYCKFQITVNTISGGTGTLQLTGLPFPSANDSITQRCAISTSRINWGTNVLTVFLTIAGTGSSVGGFVGDLNNASGVSINLSDVANSDVMVGTFYYWV